MNSLRRLALQKKKIDESSRLDVVEIARVPDILPDLFNYWRAKDLSVTRFDLATCRISYEAAGTDSCLHQTEGESIFWHDCPLVILNSTRILH